MNLLGTAFSIERDSLQACISRISSGFHPPSVLIETRHHTQRITKLVDKLESLTDKKGDEIVAKDYSDLMKLK
jgi:hypothetical protein